MAVSHAAGRGGLAGVGARIVPWRQLAIGIINVSDRLTRARHAANLNTKPSIRMPLKSLSQPPRQVDGVQPFTIASSQDTSVCCPGPLDTMTGRWTGRNSPPHPAHRER